MDQARRRRHGAIAIASIATIGALSFVWPNDEGLVASPPATTTTATTAGFGLVTASASTPILPTAFDVRSSAGCACQRKTCLRASAFVVSERLAGSMAAVLQHLLPDTMAAHSQVNAKTTRKRAERTACAAMVGSSQTQMRDVMCFTPHTIGSEEKLIMAHKTMREHGIRHLPVLRAGKLVGVLSQRDLYLLESIAGVDVEIDKVADAMTPDVYVAKPDDTLRDVTRVMADHRYGCAVVVGAGGNVLGIFTVTDALRHIADALT